VNELAELPESKIHEYAAKHLRKQQRASEAARRTAEMRREAGLVSRTVYVPARFADQVGPTIKRMIAAQTLAEAEQNLGVVPDALQHDEHQPSHMEWTLNGHSA